MDAQPSGLNKRKVLDGLTFGSRVAEDEFAELAGYFVETDLWKRLLDGAIDLILGPKGSGKSALYASLVGREGELLERNILIVSAENPSGAPAFKELAVDPPASEREFVGLWKLYVLARISTVLREYEIKNEAAQSLLEKLAEAGLVPPPDATLVSTVKRAVEYLKRLARPSAIEATTMFDPHSGAPVALSTKISLEEPSLGERSSGHISVDDLFALATEALEKQDLVVWVLFDRLDVAFADSRELEANALRALFRCYRDSSSSKRIMLKLFLRRDIWDAVTEPGMRESSHVARTATISWKENGLLQLVVQRLMKNDALKQYYGVDEADVLSDSGQHRQFFERLVPDQIDTGRNPKTFEWILGRCRDGTKEAAPREVIHLLNEARDSQVAMLDRSEPEPEGEILLSRQAFRDALPEVSKVRLEQTIYAEYPELKTRIKGLEREKTEQSAATLAQIWEVDEKAALATASQLVSIGFFERRGEKREPTFWVPFLYRPALELVQGSADRENEEEEADGNN